MRLKKRASGFVVAACTSALLWGCSASVEGGSTPVPANTTTSPSLTASTTTPSSGMPTTTTSIPVDPDTAVVEAWRDFWSVWADLRASAKPKVDPLEEVAAPAVAASALAVLERLVASSGPVEVEIATSPSTTFATATSVTVEDCVLIVPSMTEAVGVWYQADLESDIAGWKVVSLQLKDPTGCVPAEVAGAVISAYARYYDAEAEFWIPANPEHPRITEVLANPQRDFIVGLLEEHQARGIGFRNDAVHHPEIVEMRSLTELVILDCYEPDPDYGLFDLETGERLSDEPVVRLGQRNLRSAVMVIEAGVWKASDFQGQVDFECELAPTDRGLPSV